MPCLWLLVEISKFWPGSAASQWGGPSSVINRSRLNAPSRVHDTTFERQPAMMSCYDAAVIPDSMAK